MVRRMGELIGQLKVNRLSDDEAQELYFDIQKLMDLCDEGDMEDMFGTEGWRHRIGWDE